MNVAQTLSPDKQAEIIYMSSSSNDRITIYKNDNYTWLLVQDVIQSAIENHAPYRPILPYCFVMLLPILHHQVPSSILELGGGGLAIQRYLRNAYPSINITTVEHDQRILDAVEQYFPAISKPQVITNNAFSYINDAEKNMMKYDWVLSDLFHGDESPIMLKNQTSIKQLYNLINPNGWLIINCLHNNIEEIIQLGKQLQSEFRNKYYIFAVPNMQNHILMINKLKHFHFPEDIEKWNKAPTTT